LHIDFYFGERGTEGWRTVGIEVRRAVHNLQLFFIQGMHRNIADAETLLLADGGEDFVVAAREALRRHPEHLGRDAEHLGADLFGGLLYRAARNNGRAGSVGPYIEGR